MTVLVVIEIHRLMIIRFGDSVHSHRMICEWLLQFYWELTRSVDVLKCNESSNRSRRNMGNLELKLCMTAKAPGVLSQYLIYVVPISGAVHEKALYKMGTSKLLRIV